VFHFAHGHCIPNSDVKIFGIAWCGVLQCTAVCCSELHPVAVCCSIWRYVAVCCSALPSVAVCRLVLHTDYNDMQHNKSATHCNTLPNATTYCNTTVCNTLCCSVLQHIHTSILSSTTNCSSLFSNMHCETYCNMLRPTATHYNTLQHTATHCNTLQCRPVMITIYLHQ